jgi:hypothetical protein
MNAIDRAPSGDDKLHTSLMDTRRGDIKKNGNCSPYTPTRNIYQFGADGACVRQLLLLKLLDATDTLYSAIAMGAGNESYSVEDW